MTIDTRFFDPDAASGCRGRRVLLTGASGFVGQHVARQALAGGVELHSLGRGPGPAGGHHHGVDLCDRTATRSAVAEIAPDVVLHLASPGVAFGTASYDEMVSTLVTAAEALLSACSELPAPPRFVHVGTGFEYATSPGPIGETVPIVPSSTRYGAAKAAASAVVGGFDGLLPITLLRPFNIYGAGDLAPRLGALIIRKVRDGEPVEVTAGEQVRDFLHVDDFGRLLWQVASNPDRAAKLAVYNVGSGDPKPLRDYIEVIAATLEADGFAPDIRFGAVDYRPGEPMMAVPDLTRLYRDYDWRARVDFREGLADFVRWSLSQ